MAKKAKKAKKTAKVFKDKNREVVWPSLRRTRKELQALDMKVMALELEMGMLQGTLEQVTHQLHEALQVAQRIK